MNNKFIGTMVLVFLIVTGICYGLSVKVPAFDFMTLLGANVMMLLLIVITYFITRKTLQDRPEAFVRGVFSGTMIKMFAVLAVVLVYVMMNKGHLYKPLVFAFFGMYVIYTGVETILMSKMAKGKK